ncbi:claudin-4 [Cyrtonyx montezumae]|uniref:claudin-4 n=1 Tax=Cyrtonyx montezumae TaxID=9017 RepID=UPI0032DAEBB1
MVPAGGTAWRRAMASMGLQVLGIALSVIGWLASILCCALPMWRETAFVGNNIVVAQIIWEGLWMNCVVQSTGQMQCRVYDSMLALPQDLQAARALLVVAIVLAVLGTLLAITGGKCTTCVEDETAKAKVMILSGITFIVAGVLILIPICWSANAIIRDFYDPLVADSQKRELGSSLYVGWAASALLLLGGAMLCCTCPPRGEKPYCAKYSAARSLPASNYV